MKESKKEKKKHMKTHAALTKDENAVNEMH